MRLCRYQHNGTVEVALYLDDVLVPVTRTAQELNIRLPADNQQDVLTYLPPNGQGVKAVTELEQAFRKLGAAERSRLSRPLKEARLRVPLTNPGKLILLAGNYAAHIVEGGGQAPERAETFPYYFWKPHTSLTDPGGPIKIPRVSPNHVDWEIELGVIIGQRCKHVTEKEALSKVAGYTVCNDISDRRYQINPQRKPRDKDRYFDWLHGKWHDTFLPMGPCIRSAATLSDPQKLRLQLKVNGKIMQDATTAQQIFPCAALISILSQSVTLEPGDVVITGTPSGVGNARKPPIYLKAGDTVEADISEIGTLRNPVEAEK